MTYSVQIFSHYRLKRDACLTLLQNRNKIS